MTIPEQLNLLSTIKYKAWGFNMVGLFYSYETGVPKTANKWFFYLRNCADEELKKVSESYFDKAEDCLNNAIEQLTKLGYLK